MKAKDLLRRLETEEKYQKENIPPLVEEFGEPSQFFSHFIGVDTSGEIIVDLMYAEGESGCERSGECFYIEIDSWLTPSCLRNLLYKLLPELEKFGTENFDIGRVVQIVDEYKGPECEVMLMDAHEYFLGTHLDADCKSIAELWGEDWKEKDLHELVKEVEEAADADGYYLVGTQLEDVILYARRECA